MHGLTLERQWQPPCFPSSGHDFDITKVLVVRFREDRLRHDNAIEALREELALKSHKEFFFQLGSLASAILRAAVLRKTKQAFYRLVPLK